MSRSNNLYKEYMKLHVIETVRCMCCWKMYACNMYKNHH